MESTTFNELVSLVRETYGDGVVPLHAPVFNGREKQYLEAVIDSTFVSTVGPHVNEFETCIADYLGAPHAVAMMNGTAALHAALMGLGVGAGDEVLTQSLSFVATSNAIRYCGAEPVFLDIDANNLGLCVDALEGFLREHTHMLNGQCINNQSGKVIRACIPMHTFGLALEIGAITELCHRSGIGVIEDAAEALGSASRSGPCGAVGDVGVFSFNGNKIITTGGGGMVVTRDAELAKRIRHLSTTARTSHTLHFSHDAVGFNYRMPNLNAALGLAQFEQLEHNIELKRVVAGKYQKWAERHNQHVLREAEATRSNYWLNAVLLPSNEAREDFLKATNAEEVQTRAIWEPLHTLPMFANCQNDGLARTTDLASRGANLPSGVPVRA